MIGENNNNNNNNNVSEQLNIIMDYVFNDKPNPYVLHGMLSALIVLSTPSPIENVS